MSKGKNLTKYSQCLMSRQIFVIDNAGFLLPYLIFSLHSLLVAKSRIFEDEETKNNVDF